MDVTMDKMTFMIYILGHCEMANSEQTLGFYDKNSTKIIFRFIAMFLLQPMKNFLKCNGRKRIIKKNTKID